MGGYFGGRLAQSKKANVTFLVRPRREEQMQNDGLQIEDTFAGSPVERISPVQTITNAACIKDAQFDVILLTCKAYSLSSALDAIAPFVTDSTCLLPLLNGMAHYDKIRERFPKATLWGGYCGVVAALTPDGVVKKTTESQFITAGTLAGSDNPNAERLNELVELMNQAGGINATNAGDAFLVKAWEKWTFVTTLAAATCLLDGAISEILDTDNGADYVQGVYKECHNVAEKSLGDSAKELEADVSNFQRVLGDPTSPMWRDIQARGPTEADHILGDMLARAKQHGIATPLLSIAYARLQVYENQQKRDE